MPTKKDILICIDTLGLADFSFATEAITMSDNAQLNGWQKLDKTVDCMQKGDVKCVRETVNTAQDQRLFMDLLASRGQSASLPGLEIIQKDGHVDAVKVTGGKNQMTVGFDHANGGRITVKDDSPSFMKSVSNALDKASDKLDAGVKWAKDAVNSSAPVEDLNRANTSDSNMNRRWQAQEKKAGI